MKKRSVHGLIVLGVLALSMSSFASTFVLPKKAQSNAAISAFNKSNLVGNELKSLKAKKVGAPVVVRLAGMGDACDLMESYMVIQHIFIDGNFGQSTLAAKMAVVTTDLKCATDGKKKGSQITTSDLEIVDLTK